jgi:HK97 gp10 family phage protein
VASFVITGIKEIDRALAELEKNTAKKVIRQAMRKACKPLKAQVEADAPRVTGTLASNVKIKAIKKSRTKMGIRVQIGAKDYTGKTFYAAFVEYGTSKMPAKGFMRKAFDDRKEEAKGIAIEEIRKGIEKETAKLNQGGK